MSAREYYCIELSEVGDVTVVRFRTSKVIETVWIDDMGRELFHLVDGDHRKKILVNFSGVDFFASTALGKMITLDKKVKADGGRFAFCNIRPEVYEVFAITKLNRLFDIRDDLAGGLQTLDPQSVCEGANNA